MNVLLERVGQPAKKMCGKCDTVWDDDQIIDGQHGYGGDSCPFCHAEWFKDTSILFPKLKKRKTNDADRNKN